MKIDITYDKKFLVCSSDFPYELQLLKNYLTKEVDNAWLLKKKQPYLSTERCFINEYGMVPANLWLSIIKFAKTYNINYELTDGTAAYINQFQLDFNQFKEYVDKMFDGALAPIKDKKTGAIIGYAPFAPRSYQVEAAYNLLKFRHSCGEISTSAGKTLISFIIFKFLLDVAGANKILYIVPSITLATQSAEKYELYQSYLKNSKKNWEIGILKAGLKKDEKAKVESCNILFGTFQSLCKRDQVFFSKFLGCIVDECHHAATSESIKNILNKCTSLQYSIGVTGTFPKEDKIGYFNLQSYVGPLIYVLTSDQLINKEKAATPIYAVAQIMNWATVDEKRQLYYARCQKALNPDDTTLGNKLLKQEQEFINNSYVRLKYIGDLSIKMAKNTLILFGDVKGGYGQKIVDYIKDNSDKNVYYIDGSTPEENREYYKQCMAEDKNGKTILVGSIYTTGEGIDIPNIESIFLVNSAKSDRMIRQILGRGIRNNEGKEKCVLYDFVDDLRYSETADRKYHDNYMWQHYKERKSIYKEHNFPQYEQKISFS